MMKRGQISNLLRSFRLLYFTDWIRFYIERFKNSKQNKEFKVKHPDVVLPSDYLLYESFQLSYSKYFYGGLDTAKWLANHFEKHIELKNCNILDWGCGPGRVIRHMPEVTGTGSKYFGTDYNASSIKWCSENLTEVSFNENSIIPNLPYQDDFFDVIYGISIFTHLSEQMHHDWYKELYRVLKPNGIMFLTTHGDNYKAKLTDTEIAKFEKGQLIERGKVKEGHRIYTAFQPKSFMKKLFSNAEILEHIETKPDGGGWLPQDIWIIRKL